MAEIPALPAGRSHAGKLPHAVTVIFLSPLFQPFREIERQSTCGNCQCGLFDIIRHPDKFTLDISLCYFNDRYTCPRVSVFRPAHASGIDEYLVVDLLPVRLVGMAVDQE